MSQDEEKAVERLKSLIESKTQAANGAHTEALYIANGKPEHIRYHPEARALQTEANKANQLASDLRTLLATLDQHRAGREEAERERADQLHDVICALHKAWPDAEDIACDWPLGIIGSIEQITQERDEATARAEALEREVKRKDAALTEAQKVLARMDRKGGLGLDVHDWIRAALATIEAALNPPISGQDQGGER